MKELFKTSKGKYVAPVPIENLLNSDNHVELACVSGLGRPACYAVLQLGEEWRARMDDPGTRASITAELEKLLAHVNTQVESYEQLQFLVVLRDQWDIANNFLTPTLKIKRDVIESTYEPYLDDWYASRQKIIWQD